MRVRSRQMWAVALACFLAAPAQSAPLCAKDYPALKDREMVVIDEGEVLEASVDDEKELKSEQRAIVEKANALLESRTRIADAKDAEASRFENTDKQLPCLLGVNPIINLPHRCCE